MSHYRSPGNYSLSELMQPKRSFLKYSLMRADVRFSPVAAAKGRSVLLQHPLQIV
jgi:hypothetical protein